jgi:hypothetical protein
MTWGNFLGDTSKTAGMRNATRNKGEWRREKGKGHKFSFIRVIIPRFTLRAPNDLGCGVVLWAAAAAASVNFFNLASLASLLPRRAHNFESSHFSSLQT